MSIETHTDSRGRLHRDDGPALVYPDVQIEWYKHGKSHRIDGPALITPNGWTWYVNDVRIDSWDQLKHEAGLTDEKILELAIIWGEQPPRKLKQ